MTAPIRRYNRPARLNRALLALTGLILLALCAFTLSLAWGPLARLMPVFSPTAPLVQAGTEPQPWVPYVAIVASVSLGLACLRWLLAQTQRNAPSRTWSLNIDSGRGTTLLDTSHAASAIAAELLGYPGVAKASATLTGPRPAPQLRLTVHTETGTPINALRERITRHALPRIRQALELEQIPTQLLLRLDAATGGRAR